MAKHPIPTPLFDTLEQISNANNMISSQLFSAADYYAALDFLKQYSGNKATFEAYRREVERLIQWSWLIRQTSILELQRQDLENYIGFCLKPPKAWIATKRVTRFVTRDGERQVNREWRPFVATVSKAEHRHGLKPTKDEYSLSQKAIREIFTVLGSFYNHLVLEERVLTNPILLIKQKSKYLQKQQHQATVRRLTECQWQTCLKTAKEMASKEPEKHERTLFIISALYLLYLRISELVANDHWIPQMNHFHQDSNQAWWFKIVGKGNKLRNIAVSDDMLVSLKRYRESLGLSSFPSPNEKTLLLTKERGQGSMTSSRHIRSLVQQCFDEAIHKLRETNLPAEADALESATVHWLRHTGISDDINKRNRPVAHVRDDAGHSSSAITDRYNDIELKKRHQSAKHKKLKLITLKNTEKM